MMRRYPVPVSVPVSVVVRRLSYDAGRCTILGVRHSRRLGAAVASIHQAAESLGLLGNPRVRRHREGPVSYLRYRDSGLSICFLLSGTRLISRHVVLVGGRFVGGRGYMRDGGGDACARYCGGQRTSRATSTRGHKVMDGYGLGGFCGRSGRVRVGFDGGVT